MVYDEMDGTHSELVVYKPNEWSGNPTGSELVAPIVHCQISEVEETELDSLVVVASQKSSRPSIINQSYLVFYSIGGCCIASVVPWM